MPTEELKITVQGISQEELDQIVKALSPIPVGKPKIRFYASAERQLYDFLMLSLGFIGGSVAIGFSVK